MSSSNDPKRTKRVLEFCAVPRTKAEVREHFGQEKAWMFCINNLVKAGKLRNVDYGDCTRRPGRYVAVSIAASGPVEIPRVNSIWQLAEVIRCTA